MPITSMSVAQSVSIPTKCGGTGCDLLHDQYTSFSLTHRNLLEKLKSKLCNPILITGKLASSAIPPFSHWMKTVSYFSILGMLLDFAMGNRLHAQFGKFVTISSSNWICHVTPILPHNTLMPRQNFPDDLLKRIFLNENVWNSIEISLEFVPKGRFRLWLGADQATSHYLNQWWLHCWRIYDTVDEIGRSYAMFAPSQWETA